jgi:hypothetical protein
VAKKLQKPFQQLDFLELRLEISKIMTEKLALLLVQSATTSRQFHFAQHLVYHPQFKSRRPNTSEHA